MTKKEMYAELVKLDKKPEKGVNSYKADDLEKMLKEASKAHADPGINLDDPEAVYDFLSEATELELDPIEEYSLEDLQEMFKEHFKGEDGKDDEDNETQASTPANLTLNFKSSGWCEALGKSYFRGIHKCSSVEEYEALKEFAETK